GALDARSRRARERAYSQYATERAQIRGPRETRGFRGVEMATRQMGCMGAEAPGRLIYPLVVEGEAAVGLGKGRRPDPEWAATLAGTPARGFTAVDRCEKSPALAPPPVSGDRDPTASDRQSRISTRLGEGQRGPLGLQTLKGGS